MSWREVETTSDLSEEVYNLNAGHVMASIFLCKIIPTPLTVYLKVLPHGAMKRAIFHSEILEVSQTITDNHTYRPGHTML